MRIKAITIQQPWANLIATGWKSVETRNCRTKHRGQIAIHAGKTNDVESAKALWKYRGIATGHQPKGKIIAITELVDIKRYKSQQEWIEDDKSHYCGFMEPSKYGWVLGEVTILESPISWRGMPGLFDVDI